MQGAAVGLAGLFVGILKEEAGHARRMAGAQAEGDGEAAHGQGVLHIVEIRDRVGGDIRREGVLRVLLMLGLILLGQPDLGTGHLVQDPCAAGVIPVPVGQEDLLDVLGVVAGTPDAVDQQVQRLRAQAGIDQDQALAGIQQEGRDVVLPAHVPDVGRIAVDRDGMLPMGGQCLLAHAQTPFGRGVMKFLFHGLRSLFPVTCCRTLRGRTPWWHRRG